MKVATKQSKSIFSIIFLFSLTSISHAAELTAEQKNTLQITLGWMEACNDAGVEYSKNVEEVGKTLFGEDDYFWQGPIGTEILKIYENNPETAKSKNFIANPMNEKVICEMYLAGINRGILTERALRSSLSKN